MSKRGVHGFPRSGAALAPYKYFAEQNLGAGAIYLPRASQIVLWGPGRAWLCRELAAKARYEHLVRLTELYK